MGNLPDDHMRTIGAKGGRRTARRHGPKWYAALAAKRKNRRGGRPKKEIAIPDTGR